MSSEQTRLGRPSGMTGRQAPDTADDRLLTKGRSAGDPPESGPVVSDRRRDAIWPEVHDPFDTRTAQVDDRAGGNPVGNPRPTRSGPNSRA